MIVTKLSLPRRTFLRGMGVTLALPLLDAMVPAATAMARTAASPVSRLGFFYVPNGIQLINFLPAAEGKDFELTPILRPLAPCRDHIVVVTGLSNSAADPTKEFLAGPHSRANTVWLSGVNAKRTEGADVQAGTTFDQYAAGILGADTPLSSLELALEPNYLVGNCESGYSCIYSNTVSWKTPTRPLFMENNPRAVFQRLFGEGADAAARLAQIRTDRSILDSVTDHMARLQRSLGPADRITMNEYIDAVRDVERRLQKAERQSASLTTPVATPPGIPDAFEDHARLMFDLQILAYRADITRVVTFQIAREQSSRAYPWIGVPDSHHEISHHQNNPVRMGKNTKINTLHVQLFAGFLEKMRSTPDGDGTLLDHSLLLYGGGMGDGDKHSVHDLPLVLAGGAGGRLQGGRHLKYPADTPMMNLLLTMGDKVDVRLDGIGDSTGRLAGL